MDDSIRPKNPRDLDSSCETPPEESADEQHIAALEAGSATLVPRPEDDHKAVSQRAAKDIMADPAAAAGVPAQPAFLQAPPGTPERVQQVLNILPGLIGGIDEAIRDQTGVRTGIPFCLVIFAADNHALHAANFNPAAAKTAMIDFGESLKSQQPLATGEGTIEIGEAANEKPC